MGRFVYGPCSFICTFLLGLAVVATAGYLVTVPPVDRYLLGRKCIEARDAAGADELAEEWAVYQALFKEERLDESHVLIQEDSLSDDPSTDDSPIIPGASLVASIDYWKKNRTEHSLSRLFADKRASFITTEEINRLPDSGFWSAFHRSHPLSFGILSLSRVGFDHNRTEAIVSFVYSCGGLCGWGAASKFTKIDDKWQKNDGPQFEIYD